MKIAVLGTGTVGNTIGSKLIELGHQVMMGSRTANNEKALAFADKAGKNASAGTFAEAAGFAGIIFNCVKGAHCIDALHLAGNALEDKILIDLANPLDFSQGMPPGLIPQLSNFNSLGEEIQKLFPGLKVVKTLNTMWCGLMVNPKMLNNGDHSNFICGNDEEAKNTVKSLLKEFGWEEKNLIDLGPLSSARGTEAILPVWLRIYGARQSGIFNLKVIS